MKLSPAIEEYLEAIYKLQNEVGVAKTKSLANLLGLALGSVTNTVRKLKRLNLITHISYKGVKLTSKGEKAALSVVRRHRLSERLLTDLLGMDWDKVHADACMLEHSISEDVASLIERSLNQPKTCPHGNPVPTREGKIFEEETLKPLTDVKPKEKFIIVKITEENPELLRYLKEHRITPRAYARILELIPPDNSISIKADDEVHYITQKLASKIWVKEMR
ncbi:MAG: metal-dependent transcriptional regulator [Candidatus Bathyarchaeia archaeon]